MSKETGHRVDSTLSKGLAILERLTGMKSGIGVSDLSREMGLTKSNTFRLLQTLTALGYVRREPDRSYAATLKAWQVGRSVVENLNLRTAASPMMLFLSEETKETIYLAVRDGLNVVYIDKIESTKPIRTWNPIGGAAPIYCVGTGKALLAEDYTLLRDQVVATLEPFTDRTITDAAALDKDMAATRLRGYGIDTGEFRPNVLSFGAAIHLPNGEAIGALGVSVPDINLGKGDSERIGALVRHAACAVSENLGRL
ncbi:MAG: IclR family transcriptional regulator [Boseongicola sp. SB0676_bin_33]|uniref:IclR family transcriptional regulator n=1 Tax=Boseongicola sp. SB0664_bin_43 TaxID=2604844 RepID=A0A6B0Y331_9RHOB|nr:IclR family transcriptional regulator [Boseongicola sp. SB0664_bin_43]MYF89816.1 IclR family transcriptional regulator [Boseongicola sp. SB0676_bin_33]